MRAIAILSLSFLVGGCVSERPLVQKRPATYQANQQAVEHWRAAAATAVDSLVTKLPRGQISLKFNNMTPFDGTYGSLLAEQLTQRGYIISQEGHHGMPQLNVRTEVITHTKRINPLVPNPFARMGYDVKHWFVGGSVDPHKTNYELCTTHDVITPQGVIHCVVGIAYIPCDDLLLYTSATPPMPSYVVPLRMEALR